MTEGAKQKIAWVTGVNRGMGTEIMQQLIANNIQVVGFDISTDNIAIDVKADV